MDNRLQYLIFITYADGNVFKYETKITSEQSIGEGINRVLKHHLATMNDARESGLLEEFAAYDDRREIESIKVFNITAVEEVKE